MNKAGMMPALLLEEIKLILHISKRQEPEPLPYPRTTSQQTYRTKLLFIFYFTILQQCLKSQVSYILSKFVWIF
jgi:hypothetical protein